MENLAKLGMSRMSHAISALMLMVALTMSLASCALPLSSTQARVPLAPGWTWYQDTRFPFQLPLPPGWRAGSYMDGFSSAPDCQYVVDALPPVSQGDPGKGVEEHVPEIITLRIPISCSEWRLPEDDPIYTQEPRPITISGTQATLWDNDDATSIQRAAIAHFGGKQYIFYFSYAQTSLTPITKGAHELALYMQVLRGFVYTGK